MFCLIAIWSWGWYQRGMSDLIALILTGGVVITAFQVLRLISAMNNAATPSTTATTPTPASAPVDPTDFTTDWLAWLGNGEAHRGMLVFLFLLFWTMFFWSAPIVQTLVQGNFLFVFAAWGLVTVTGLVIIRSLFVRQTTLPGQEVPKAAGDSKSQTGGK